MYVHRTDSFAERLFEGQVYGPRDGDGQARIVNAILLAGDGIVNTGSSVFSSNLFPPAIRERNRDKRSPAESPGQLEFASRSPAPRRYKLQLIYSSVSSGAHHTLGERNVQILPATEHCYQQAEIRRNMAKTGGRDRPLPNRLWPACGARRTATSHGSSGSHVDPRRGRVH